MFYNIKRKIKKVIRFFKRIPSYIPIIWNDCDYDYGAVLALIEFKLKHIREHIVEHDLIVGAEEIGEEIAHAEKLIKVYRDECPSDKAIEAWNELFDHMKDHMQDWWD